MKTLETNGTTRKTLASQLDRLDFPAWRATHAERDRRLLDDLMLGERTLDVAGKYGLSPGRVSQLRREFLADWRRYLSEPPVV